MAKEETNEKAKEEAKEEAKDQATEEKKEQAEEKGKQEESKAKEAEAKKSEAKEQEAKKEEETKEAKAEKEEPKAKEKEAEKKPEKKEEPEQPEEKKEKREWSKDIQEMGEKIVSLTLMEAKELADYLKEEHGIEPAAGGAVMMAGPGAAGGEGQAEEEKDSFDVVLKEFGDKKIQVIKEVRALTGLGLKEAKSLVDGVPKPVKEGLNKEEAERAKQQLEEAGAVVELA